MTFQQKLHQYDIILASKSPRRKELLALADIPFRVEVRPTHEEFPQGLSPVDVARFLCNQKMDPFEEELKKKYCIVITADTIVVVDGNIINKPANFDDSIQMLSLLSGRTHQVITGVCIGNNGQRLTLEDSTRVTFKEFGDEEMEYYIHNYQPYDKAGSYGVQDWLGMVGITRLEGTYANVMGLPVHRVYDSLKGILKSSLS